MPDQKGIYLYCFFENLPDGKLREISADSYQLDLKGVKALVTDVRLDEFTGEKGEANLQNMEWLLPKVILHETITETVRRHTAVFPAAFGSIFSSSESLQATVEKNKQAIIEFFNFTKNADEIGVKGFLDREKAKNGLLEADFSTEMAQLAGLSAGKRFFAEKKLSEKAESLVERKLDEICRRSGQKLSVFTNSAVTRKIVRSEADGEQVLNWAFLIERQKLEDFFQAVEEINADVADFGLKLRLSEVLPPYSFVPKLI